MGEQSNELKWGMASSIAFDTGTGSIRDVTHENRRREEKPGAFSVAGDSFLECESRSDYNIFLFNRIIREACIRLFLCYFEGGEVVFVRPVVWREMHRYQTRYQSCKALSTPV